MAMQPAAGGQPQGQPQQPQGPQRQPPNDQVDGDLADWIKNINNAIPSRAHASFSRAWGGVGEHEMFGKLMEGIRRAKEGLVSASKANDDIAQELKQHANKKYSERQFNAAVAMYTRAMLYAAKPETAAVLANNRAAVMLEQGLPLAALSDAQYAVTANPGFANGIARRGKCLGLLGRAEFAAQDTKAAAGDGDRVDDAEVSRLIDTAMQEAEVDAAADGLVPAAGTSGHCGTDALMAAGLWQRGPKHEEKGFHVRAGKEAPAGTTLLIERPLASAVRGEGLLCSCAACHRQTTCLYPGAEWMSRGLRSRGLFCSAACATALWNAHGEAESANPFWLACPVDLLLASRVMRAVVANGSDALRRRYDELRDWSQETNPGATAGGFESAAVCAAVAFGALDPAKGQVLVDAMRKIVANAQPISFVDRVSPDAGPAAAKSQIHSYVKLTIAKGLYPHATLVNHSCDPNVFASFKGNPYRAGSELHLRLIKPVMEGEELCVAYDGVTKHTNHSTRGRIRDLRGKYGFACTCPACFNQVDEPLTKEEQEHYVKAADYYQKGRRLMREGDLRSAVDVLSQSLEMVMRYVCPPPRPPQFVVSKTHDSIAQAHQMMGNRAKCIEHVELSVKTIAAIQGADHVDLAREYAKLSTLCAAAPEASVPGAKEKAKEAAARAVEILRLHYPRSKALEAEVALLQGELSLGADDASA